MATVIMVPKSGYTNKNFQQYSPVLMLQRLALPYIYSEKERTRMTLITGPLEMEQKSNSIKCNVVHLHTNKNCSVKMEAFQLENRGMQARETQKTWRSHTSCIKPPQETVVENSMLEVISCKKYRNINATNYGTAEINMEYCGQF